jgi:hypothetical protein
VEIIASAVCRLLHDRFLLGLLFDSEEGDSKQEDTKHNSDYCQHHASFFFGLFFDSENGGGMFLRNVC